MQYGSIPGIDRPVSRLIIGSMVCNSDEQDATNALLDAWVEAGGNCIDTAYVYSGGKSEVAIGAWFKARNNRDQIILLDKGAHPKGPEPRVNPEAIVSDISESLERLQEPFIDLYLLHRDDPNFPVGPIVECLNEQHRVGHIGQFGGSNWTTERIQEANHYAALHGLQGFVASSPHFSLAHASGTIWPGCTNLDAESVKWHQEHQIPVLPWSSQASGFFTGRYAPDVHSDPNIERVFYSEGNWKRLKRATEIGEQKGVTANNIALAWVLHQPFPVFPLIGPRTVEELHSSLPALDVKLTDAELKYLNLESDHAH